MREIRIIDAPDQRFTVLLAGKRCGFRFRYNVTSQRWSFDLDIADAPALRGRRVVLGRDLLAAFDFGIGSIFAVDYDRTGAAPDRQALPARRVRLFHHVGEMPR